MTQEFDDLVRDFNALKQVVENLEQPEVTGAWADFTPTLYQNAVVASSVTEAKYFKNKNKINVIVSIQSTAAAVAPGFAVTVLFPTTLTPANGGTPLPLGTFTVWDKSFGWYFGFAFYAGVVSGLTGIRGTAHNANNHIGVVPNFALANTDEIGLNLTYRIA